ncbi:MocR-like pyridoxine biosynthesis transcription factor PdxR [Chitinophaga nivalis]|uniref:PLP-dependent aminotransferase family protein n=1 Tax=Chitinophaga nivalis TaxID=2991709 RepID=A0ABT3IS84_9BACT|nr:PLP-dependent aminotransferase family protein [Chitinophaga nivalis]MCW3463501.1 PLP-dependent aminotransferase family protein [Chitinophaga nivalis]MCW3486809.1 PLP-dependent aminotransferase family protein [Chitinophaga nivalis]
MFSFNHIISIQKEGKVSIYRQIAVAIIHAISNGILKPGTHLPGSRDLAKILGVHRKTVIAAYEELSAQDWIVIVPRKYVAVSESIPLLQFKKWSPSHVQAPYDNDLRMPFRLVDKNTPDENVATIPEVIIDDGHPDVRLSPIDDLLKTYRSLTARKYTAKKAGIGNTQGALYLRQELATYLSETRGLNITTDNLLITHGAQMSIYLSAHLLLNPASNVIVGKPNYPIANKTFAGTGANIIEVKVDEEGIDTDAIEAICKKKKINVVYVIPHHHYPTTVTLSVDRRMKLLALSKAFSFVIIEDDYDYEYHYTSSPYLPLASAQHNGNIIYIGSFSKVLDPSIRIGFTVAPKNFIQQCTALRETIDVGGDGYMQNALATLIKAGELKRHLKKAKKCYHQRRDFLDTLLKEKLSTHISYTLPSGGMAIWIKLKPHLAVEKINAGPQLRISKIDTAQNAFRFGFASLDEKELTLAVALLEKNIRQIKKK